MNISGPAYGKLGIPIITQFSNTSHINVSARTAPHTYLLNTGYNMVVIATKNIKWYRE